MRTVRRVAFATPLVMVVACQRPAPQHPDGEDEEEEHEDDEAPVIAQAPAVPVDAAEPDAWAPPYALVRELPPLAPELSERERERRYLEECRSGVHTCNPPPPNYRPPPPEVPKPRVVKVTLMQREGTGARVRVKRFWQLSPQWDGVFLDAHQVPMPGGECTFGRSGETEIDCTTALSVEQLTDSSGAVRELRVSPSSQLVEQIERERANYVPGGGVIGRVLRLVVDGNGVELTIGIGADQGVDKSWTAVVLNSNGKPVLGGDCAIVRVNRNITICRAKVTPDQVKMATGVRLTPPPER